jgi:hypothetical protein
MRLCLGSVTRVASIVTTDFASPDCHKRARIAIGATPSQQVAISGLHNGKDMTGALVGHLLRFG